MVVAPAGLRLQFEAGTVTSGAVVVGGDPVCAIHLDPPAAAAVDRWRAGEPVGGELGDLARALIDLGMATPAPTSLPAGGRGADVAVVVPARNAAATLPALLASLPGDVAEIVVVDDGSTDATAAVARDGGAKVVSHAAARGPAAARNAGLEATSAGLVLFVDADASLDGDAVGPLVAWFADPAVGAAAPRIVEPGRSALDMGPVPARVAVGGRVPFVPSAALLVRRQAMRAVGGFDETMHFGEDADLCWRLAAAGWSVRYEPAAVVRHRHRASALAAARRLWGYGTAGGALAVRHPGAVAALTVGPNPAASLARLVRAGAPPALAVRLVARDELKQLRSALWAVTRPWLPAFAALAAVSRRARWFLAITLIVRHRSGWRQIGDDAVFAAGLWYGAARHRTAAPLAVRRRPPVARSGAGWRVIGRYG